MRLRFVILAAFLICGQTVVTFAQGVQTSAVVGAVRDSSRAVVPGASVMVEGSGLIGGARRAVTDSDGVYRFQSLPPGVYVMRAQVAGFADDVRSNIELPVGVTLTVDLVVRPPKVDARVDVNDVAPMVDVRNPAASTRINQRFLENLPSRRSVNDLINLAPGVTAGVGFGGTQGSNALYVEGVDTTNPFAGGAYLQFNQNWLQQLEVAGLGAGPEYGETTGVSANAVFRSGSNRLSGLFEALTTSPSWLARNTRSLSEELQTAFEPLQLLRWWDRNAQIGGPIVRDRVWYFGGLQSFVYDKKPAGYSGPGNQTLSDNRTLLKLTAAIPGGRVEGFVQQGFYRSTSEDLSPQNPPDATYDYRQPQTTWQARLTLPRGNTLFEFRNAGFNSDGHQDPHPPATREGPPRAFDTATQINSGNAFTVADFNRTRHTTTFVASHYRSGRWGRHDLRGGIDYERAWMQTANGPAGGMLLTYTNGVPTSVTTWAGEAVEAWTNRTGLFVHDVWQMGPVTVSPGLRVDVNRASIPETHNIYRTTPVAPSLGLAWDVREDHTLAIRAHAGSSVDPVMNGRISSVDFSHRNPRTDYNITSTGEWVYRSGGTIGPNTTSVAAEIDAARVNQVTGSVEWQFLRDWAAETNVIYRRFGDFVGMYETNVTWGDPIQRQDPGPDNQLGTADDGEFLSVYPYVSGNNAFVYGNVPDAATRHYRAIQLIARKRFTHGWQTQISYTWPHTWGTVSNNAQTNAGVNDLGTGGSYGRPNQTINKDGVSAFDPREFKVLADVTLRQLGGLTVGAVYRYYTGQTWARRATIRDINGSDSIFVEPRGSRRLPAINNIDLRIEKHVPVRSIRLGISADIFNVTNQGVPNSDSSFPMNIMSGPFFGIPAAWVDPRLLRVGVRLIF